jgi:hypothetical protein
MLIDIVKCFADKEFRDKVTCLIACQPACHLRVKTIGNKREKDDKKRVLKTQNPLIVNDIQRV